MHNSKPQNVRALQQDESPCARAFVTRAIEKQTKAPKRNSEDNVSNFF